VQERCTSGTVDALVTPASKSKWKECLSFPISISFHPSVLSQPFFLPGTFEVDGDFLLPPGATNKAEEVCTPWIIISWTVRTDRACTAETRNQRKWDSEKKQERRSREAARDE